MADCSIFVTNVESDGVDETVSLKVAVAGYGVINAAIDAVVPIGATQLAKNNAIKAAAVDAAANLDPPIAIGVLDQKALYAGVVLI